VDALVAAVDALCAVDPRSLGDGETVVARHRRRERLAAVVTAVVTAFGAGRSWAADGDRSAPAWLAVRCLRDRLRGSFDPPVGLDLPLRSPR
jgi:hypothetical protein